ncbi:hypothetical protein F4820DRAFT_404301 [Hypoxylon rubiginosum]|uniref:Uncharacterized protein n=1 Tax=Hypoxylon rubiginosum TaxID=110542 RepID=A0ACB9ZFB2_9PEZI|nr:hypothetical protein F4820DRAFT_404301 [Hypoxylon rubiginosum]
MPRCHYLPRVLLLSGGLVANATGGDEWVSNTPLSVMLLLFRHISICLMLGTYASSTTDKTATSRDRRRRAYLQVMGKVRHARFYGL